MKTALFLGLFLATGMVSGCVHSSHLEQRVIELPAGNPKTSLSTAAQIGKAVYASGLANDIHRKFPNLTQQQLQGLYIRWNSGIFQGKQNVFLLTGISYKGTLPEAKAVADFCETRVKQLTVKQMVDITNVRKMDFQNGDSALVMEYKTTIDIGDKVALRSEVDWIWDAFEPDVEGANLKTGVIRAVHPEGTGVITKSKGYGFVFVKREDGQWHCLQDEKK